MAGLNETIVTLVEGSRRFDQFYRDAMRSAGDRRTVAEGVAETADFGTNPGNLRMLSLVPADLPTGAPLVVVLHGCRQEALGYADAAGWSALARRHGFALLLPEQRRDNNPNGCFNWYQAGDVGRDRGEALSIREMIEHMLVVHALDHSRVYITGLSAGGAMACALLAVYPEIFAGGAIMAGLPYRSARNAQQALAVMARPSERSERVWGFLVRSASAHRGPWPSISIWHGGNDRIVVPANALALAAQWRNVHGIAEDAVTSGLLHGHAHSAWHNSDGRTVIEMVLVEGMGHGTAIDASGTTEGLGEPAQFVLQAGIASTLHVARQWGLTSAAATSETPSASAQVQTEASPEPPPPPAAPLLAGIAPLGRLVSQALRRLARPRRMSKLLSAHWEGDWEVHAAAPDWPKAGPMFVGRVSSRLGDASGRQSRTLRQKLRIDGHQRLTFERRLDLRAAVGLFTTAAFEVLVDDVVIDRETVVYADRRVIAWTRKVIDLDRFAGREVELRFEVSALSTLMIEATAEAALRGIAIESRRGR